MVSVRENWRDLPTWRFYSARLRVTILVKVGSTLLAFDNSWAQARHVELGWRRRWTGSAGMERIKNGFHAGDWM